MVPLIAALADPRAYRHPVDRVEVIETHISWVLLAGDYAYKIKKAVVLPFVDFGTLAARRRYCQDEVRLNRRLAPQVHLGVVSITGSVQSPIVEGGGSALEYAVKMRRFGQDALFDRMLASGSLRPELIDRLAAQIAAFHARAPVTADPDFGTPNTVLQTALDNFAELLAHADSGRRTTLQALADWTREAFAQLEPALAARHREGRVRECHGDLHLRNIALIDGEPVPFDCIEFNPALRWIDVMNETAFLVMDLLDRGRPDLGYRFLDGYLAANGDYAGVAVLRFYLVYRALVRAKIHDLRAHQAGADPRAAARLQAAADHYLALAGAIAHGKNPALVLMHGFSGAGKSRVAAALVEVLGAIRLRSDVERKRLFGLDGDARTGSPVGGGLYDRQASDKTYARLAELAGAVVGAGYPVILDAAFLARSQRAPMHALASRLKVPFRIVDCAASADALRRRIAARAAHGRDPSEATLEVLEHQRVTHEPLTHGEQQHLVACAMEGPEADSVATCVANVARSLRAASEEGER